MMNFKFKLQDINKIMEYLINVIEFGMPFSRLQSVINTMFDCIGIKHQTNNWIQMSVRPPSTEWEHKNPSQWAWVGVSRYVIPRWIVSLGTILIIFFKSRSKLRFSWVVQKTSFVVCKKPLIIFPLIFLGKFAIDNLTIEQYC